MAHCLRREIEANFSQMLEAKKEEERIKRASLMMENKPEYLITFVALVKLGFEVLSFSFSFSFSVSLGFSFLDDS